MPWELAREIGAALEHELGERATVCLFYENEGRARWWALCTAVEVVA